MAMVAEPAADMAAAGAKVAWVVPTAAAIVPAVVAAGDPAVTTMVRRMAAMVRAAAATVRLLRSGSGTSQSVRGRRGALHQHGLQRLLQTPPNNSGSQLPNDCDFLLKKAMDVGTPEIWKLFNDCAHNR
ncbi:MAG: hypothetical protein WDN31_05875 [Hyphomicrobium sp.]